MTGLPLPATVSLALTGVLRKVFQVGLKDTNPVLICCTEYTNQTPVSL